MNKDLNAYQKVHEAMGTLARGVGNNTKDIEINEKSLHELWMANQNALHTFEQINGILDSNHELHDLHVKRLDIHQKQIKELSDELKHTKRVLLVYVWFIALVNLGFLLYGLFQ